MYDAQCGVFHLTPRLSRCSESFGSFKTSQTPPAQQGLRTRNIAFFFSLILPKKAVMRQAQRCIGPHSQFGVVATQGLLGSVNFSQNHILGHDTGKDTHCPRGCEHLPCHRHLLVMKLCGKSWNFAGLPLAQLNGGTKNYVCLME